MPCEYQIDTDQKVLLFTATGTLTAEEIQACRAGMRADPRFEPTFSILGDLREVSEVSMEAGEMRGVALTSPFESQARLALVVPSDVIFGLSRMYGAFRRQDPEKFQVIRDMAKARRWLGLDPEDQS